MKPITHNGRFYLMATIVGEGEPIGKYPSVRLSIIQNGYEIIKDVPHLIKKGLPKQGSVVMVEGYLRFYKSYPQLLISNLTPIMETYSKAENQQEIKQAATEISDIDDDLPF